MKAITDIVENHDLYHETKLCKICGLVKPLIEFTKSNRQNSYRGYKTQNYPFHAYCKACNAKRATEWRKHHKNYRGTGKLKKIPPEDRLIMSAIRAKLSDAKTRCKKHNKPQPTVTAEYLYDLYKKQGRACALTGTPLDTVKDSPTCLSLDQIDPSKGYTEGNVQWLCWAVNRAKGELPLNQFYGMCEAVLDYKQYLEKQYQKEQRLSRNGVDSSESKCETPTVKTEDEDIVCSA